MEQSGKPDKKIYTITEKGFDKLVDWMYKPAGPAVIKDEMMLKLSCIQVWIKKLPTGCLMRWKLVIRNSLANILKL